MDTAVDGSQFFFVECQVLIRTILVISYHNSHP